MFIPELKCGEVFCLSFKTGDFSVWRGLHRIVIWVSLGSILCVGKGSQGNLESCSLFLLRLSSTRQSVLTRYASRFVLKVSSFYVIRTVQLKSQIRNLNIIPLLLPDRKGLDWIDQNSQERPFLRDLNTTEDPVRSLKSSDSSFNQTHPKFKVSEESGSEVGWCTSIRSFTWI